MVLNSLGVQLDPGLRHRLPRDPSLPPLAGPAPGVRLSTPRIPPIGPEQWTPEQRKLITPQIREKRSELSFYATMIQHPILYTSHASFGSYLRGETGLPPRTRELLIMRTAFLIGAEYLWAHHVEDARAAGLTDREIARIAAGPDATGWSEENRAVLLAADELRREAFITNLTWGILTKHYDAKQLIEIVFTVGGYTMTCLAIHSFGVQVEPGYPTFPGASQKGASSRGVSRQPGVAALGSHAGIRQQALPRGTILTPKPRLHVRFFTPAMDWRIIRRIRTHPEPRNEER
jgi:AhpD family alkylhydroperoxidase